MGQKQFVCVDGGFYGLRLPSEDVGGSQSQKASSALSPEPDRRHCSWPKERLDLGVSLWLESLSELRLGITDVLFPGVSTSKKS